MEVAESPFHTTIPICKIAVVKDMGYLINCRQNADLLPLSHSREAL